MEDRINKYIDDVILEELARVRINKDPFLKNGASGICLFLFGLHSITKNPYYKDLAINLFEDVPTWLPKKCPLEIYQGITGIGLALIAGIEKGYITGVADTILAGIDDYIYKYTIKAMDKHSDRYMSTYLDILLYIHRRIINSGNEVFKEIFGKLWITLFNKVSLSFEYDFILEPNPADLKYNLAEFIYICALGYSLGTSYQNRIHKVLTDFQNFIIPYHPILHTNKLTLVLALHHLTSIIGLDNCWQTYKETLINEISLEHMIKHEILPNDIYLSHGVSCVYLLLYSHNYPLNSNQRQMVVEKILKSNLFNYDYPTMVEKGFIGLDGILGCIYTLLLIKNKIHEKN